MSESDGFSVTFLVPSVRVFIRAAQTHHTVLWSEQKLLSYSHKVRSGDGSYSTRLPGDGISVQSCDLSTASRRFYIGVHFFQLHVYSAACVRFIIYELHFLS